MGTMGSMGGPVKTENAQSADPMVAVVPPTVGVATPATVVPAVAGVAAPMQPYYQGYYTYQQYINGNLMTFTVPYAMVTPPSSDSDAPAVATFAMPGAYRMGNCKAAVSREEMVRRMKAVERYRKKKERRSFKKNVRYQLRKENAEKRVRVKGRFAKEEE